MLVCLGARNLLFSEADQAVYELNDLAAYAWRSLETGMRADAIAGELIATGVDPDEARSTVAATVERLEVLRCPAAQSSPPAPAAPTEQLTRRSIVIAGVAVQLHLSTALVADVEAVFGRLIADVQDSDFQLCARLVEDTVTCFSPGQPEWLCERPQFIPLLKAQLIEGVLHCARYEVALHAAALVRDHQAVLLVGSPGAGKTTLAIALARAGLEVMADDVVLLDEHGLVNGVPLPFAAKASAWPMLSRHWPGIAALPSHVRPDGQRLCYISHDPLADPRPRRIGRVILLDRREQAVTRVEELDLACALSALVAEGATRDERLSPGGFTALVEGLRDARCCRLTYSDFLDAADAVRSLDR